MINKILFTIFAVIAIWKAFSMISKLTGNKGGVPRPKGTAGRRDGTRVSRARSGRDESTVPAAVPISIRASAAAA